MDKHDYSLLKRLSEAFGPTGEENEVLPILIEEIKPYATRLYRDRMGNLIAEKGKGSDVVFCAHMDEVGFMITEIQKDGSLRFSQVGGVNPASLPSKRLVVGSSRIPGVIRAKPVHFSRKEKEYAPPAYSDLVIDIGAGSDQEAKGFVSVGDNAVFDTEFSYLDSRKNTLKGKALDDRLGCFLLCKMIADERIKNAVFAFTVQEETGLRGAFALADTERFSYGVAIDSTTASDVPGNEGADRVCCQLKGGVLSFADGATIYDHALIASLFEELKNQGIAVQTKTVCAGGNDASSLQKAGIGMKAISLSSPCRYIHAPVATVKEKDIESMTQALFAIYEFIGREETK